jgi:protoheme ferro-lyase
VSAWITAEKLGMSDMMDHIVDKLEALAEPELQSILVFACQAYSSQDTVLPSQAKLKDYLATYIAENWWIYLLDYHLQSGFIEQLQKLPELERDIYRRRIPSLDERIKRNEEDDDTEMG